MVKSTKRFTRLFSKVLKYCKKKIPMTKCKQEFIGTFCSKKQAVTPMPLDVALPRFPDAFPREKYFSTGQKLLKVP